MPDHLQRAQPYLVFVLPAITSGRAIPDTSPSHPAYCSAARFQRGARGRPATTASIGECTAPFSCSADRCCRSSIGYSGMDSMHRAPIGDPGRDSRLLSLYHRLPAASTVHCHWHSARGLRRAHCSGPLFSLRCWTQRHPRPPFPPFFRARFAPSAMASPAHRSLTPPGSPRLRTPLVPPPSCALPWLPLPQTFSLVSAHTPLSSLANCVLLFARLLRPQARAPISAAHTPALPGTRFRPLRAACTFRSCL